MDELTDEQVANYDPLCQQVGTELSFFLQFLTDFDVKSILSIGCLQGGLEFNIAKHYHAKGKQCFIVGLDWMLHKEMLVTLEVVKRRFPGISLNYIRCDTQRKNNVCALGWFDFVFVDGDHSYQGCKNDYDLALKHTKKYIGFHDLKETDYYVKNGIDCGVQQLWQEIKSEKKHRFAEAIDMNCEWGGIGILDMNF